jgi:hypothetical protein
MGSAHLSGHTPVRAEGIDTLGPAEVFRLMPDRPIPLGEVPAYWSGLWYASCPDCGPVGSGVTAWCQSPEVAAVRATTHNRRSHPESSSPSLRTEPFSHHGFPTL